MLAKISNALWGKFESRDEFRKFGLLASIFAFIIGTYWTLRPMKDGIFGAIVGTEFTPQAKILSVTIIIPLVMWYSKLVGTFPRRKVFYGLTLFYALGAAVIALILMSPTYGLPNTVASPTRLIGWVWYVFVESFGSLIVALFWAIVTEITPPDQAKRGFPLIALFGQVGNIFFPLVFVNSLVPYFGTSWPIVALCGVFSFLICAMLWYFMNSTPKNQLAGYKGETDVEKTVSWKKIFRVIVIGGGATFLLMAAAFMCPWVTQVGVGLGLSCSQIWLRVGLLFAAALTLMFVDNLLGGAEETVGGEHEAGFLDGLKVLFSHGYMFGLFLIVTFYEVIVTIIDFHFKMIVKASSANEAANTVFLGWYAVATGIVATLCVALGINNIQRQLGMKVSLILMPVLVMAAVLMIKFYPEALYVAFAIMVLSKAVNYALNQPTLKQLYIPTSKEAKFKAQAWIEMFGSRGAKGYLASSFNSWGGGLSRTMGSVAGPAYFITVATFMSGGIVGVWVLAAIYVANKYDKAIKDDKVVC